MLFKNPIYESRLGGEVGGPSKFFVVIHFEGLGILTKCTGKLCTCVKEFHLLSDKFFSDKFCIRKLIKDYVTPKNELLFGSFCSFNIPLKAFC